MSQEAIDRDTQILECFPWLWSLRSKWCLGSREVVAAHSVWKDGRVDDRLKEVLCLKPIESECRLYARIRCVGSQDDDYETHSVIPFHKHPDSDLTLESCFATTILKRMQSESSQNPMFITHLVVEPTMRSLGYGKWPPLSLVVFRVGKRDFVDWLNEPIAIRL